MRRRQDRKIVLIDFGAVKEINTVMVNSQGQTSVSVIVGTNGYMPSEQAAGQPKLSSDVYAVGMLGISALTGKEPHELPKDPTDGEVIWRNYANVSDKLALVLSKMVSYYFRDRYFSAGEALQAIQSLNQTFPRTIFEPRQPSQSPQRPPTPPTSTSTSTKILSPHWTRRRVIQSVGFGCTGLGLAILVPRLWQSNLPTVANSQTVDNSQVVTVDKTGKIIDRRNFEAKSSIEDLGNGVSLEMVQIPRGTFLMGSLAKELQRGNDEGSQREVEVNNFFMGRYPVTQAQYQAIMGKNPANFPGDKRPVETVSWDEAVEFCTKLSQKTGKTYRLPSEAEWEYACRARTTTPFYFGETITTELVNYDGSFPYASAPKGERVGETTDVGKFPPNSFGLYDMHGNIWEWCQDTYKDNYEKVPTDGRAYESGNNNHYRLLRGGSWFNVARYCRSAVRNSRPRAYRYSHVGFRVVAVA
jgi:formylglycine-generating enzyme required for sulfatase activity